MTTETYESKPIVDNPLIDRIDNSTLMAFFRCNSCLTCKWKKEVLDKDPIPYHNIGWCAQKHHRENLVDMVEYFGYSKE